jgi:hypothetical protein
MGALLVFATFQVIVTSLLPFQLIALSSPLLQTAGSAVYRHLHIIAVVAAATA